MISRDEFERQLVLCWPWLNSYASRLSESKEDAQDLAQATALRAIEKLHQFKEGTNLRAWMSRIMYSVFINGARRARREVRTVELQNVDVPCSVDADSDETYILKALELIPKEQADVLVDLALGGLSYKEIARRRKIPLGTVMSRLFRGREAMKERLRNVRE